MYRFRLLSIALNLALLLGLSTLPVPTVGAQTDREILPGELPEALEGIQIS